MRSVLAVLAAFVSVTLACAPTRPEPPAPMLTPLALASLPIPAAQIANCGLPQATFCEMPK